MPPKSKRQARFMRVVASGSAHAPGLSKKEASEYVSGYSTKGLPESAPKKKRKRKAQKKKAKRATRRRAGY